METPSCYLLGFHFVFILSAFAAHGLRTGFVASLRVAAAFLLAAGLVALAQVPLLGLRREPGALAAALVACVASGARLRGLVEAARAAAAASNPLRPGDSANFWQ